MTRLFLAALIFLCLSAARGAQAVINVGTLAGDGTGDPLRTALQKANTNFTELYGMTLARTNGTGTNLTVNGLSLTGVSSNQPLTLNASGTIRSLPDAVSVLARGAVKDGATEDSAAFNAAIDEVSARGGGVVFVPYGTYRVSGLGSNRIKLKSNVRLIGENSIIDTGIPTSAECVAVFIDSSTGNKTNIIVDGFTLLSTTNIVSDGAYGVAINCQTPGDIVRDITIRNVTAKGFAFDGLLVSGNPNAYPEDILIEKCRFVANKRHGAAVTNWRRITFRDCVFEDNRGETYSMGLDCEPNATLSGFDLIVDGCYFNNNAYRNLVVQSGNGVEVRGVRIANCISQNAGDNGITVLQASGVSIENCRSSNNGGMGLDLGQVDNANVTGEYYSNARSGVQVGLSRSCRINVVSRNNGERGIIINGSGGEARESMFNTITSSICQSNTLTGITIAGGTANTVTGNVLEKNGQEGLLITQSSFANVVTVNNILENSQSSDLSAANVQIETASSFNSVTANLIRKAIKFHTGTATAGGATNITLATTASALDDFYVNETVRLISGDGSGQAVVITSYNGTTKVVGVAAFSPDPGTNTVYEVTGAKRPLWGMRAHSSSCVLNRFVANDSYEGGESVEGLSDNGTSTVKYLPVAEGGTGTGDLSTLPGDVGSIDGWFISDNNKGLKIKNAAGSAREIVKLDTGDNAILSSGGGAGGTIYLIPADDNSKALRILSDGKLRYGGVATNAVLWTNTAGDIIPLTIGSGLTLTNGVLTAP